MENISFREFRNSDFEFMYKWLNTDFVKQWYYKRIWTYDEIVKLCTPYALKQNTTGQPIESFIILYNNIEIGYIQTCLLKDYPEYNELLEVGNDSADIDLFIGEEEYIHKGLGSKIVKKIIENKIFANKNVNRCIIAPDPENLVAINAFKKVGFKHIKTIQIPNEDGLQYVMEYLRNDIK